MMIGIKRLVFVIVSWVKNFSLDIDLDENPEFFSFVLILTKIKLSPQMHLFPIVLSLAKRFRFIDAIISVPRFSPEQHPPILRLLAIRSFIHKRNPSLNLTCVFHAPNICQNFAHGCLEIVCPQPFKCIQTQKIVIHNAPPNEIDRHD